MQQTIVDVAVCESVLRTYYNDDNFEIIKFEAEPFSNEVNGYVSYHYLLKIEVKRKRIHDELHFFTKKIRLTNEIMINSNKIVDMFEKEKFVYRKFLFSIKKDLGLELQFIPKCFYAKDGLLILENLNLRGFTSLDSAFLDKNHIKLVLKCLVKFHSASLIYEELKSKQTKSKWRFPCEFELINKEALFRKEESHWGHYFINTSINALYYLIELIFNEEKIVEDFKLKLNNFLPIFLKVFNTKSQFRCVCSHGDLWPKNLLFKYENGLPVDCRIVDFQINRYSPPAQDVAFLIVHTSKGDALKYDFLDYFNFYIKTLEEELQKFKLDLKSIIPTEEFEKTMNFYLVIHKFTKCCYGIISFMSQDNQQKYFKNEKNFYYFYLKDRKSLIHDLFPKEEFYRNALKSSVLDLYESLKDFKELHD